MRRLKLFLSLIAAMLLLLAKSPEAFASHAQASDITYVHVANNQYRIFVRFYRDRTGIDPPTTVTLNYRNGNLTSCTAAGNITLQPIFAASFDSLGSNLCANVLQQYNGSPPFGTDIVTYTGLLNLPGTSNNWVMWYAVNARPTMSNLTTSGDIYTYAIINNQPVVLDSRNPGTAPINNSSIQFSSTDPRTSLAISKQNPLTYRTCLGQEYEINFNFINPDADSLSFALAPALVGSTTSPCSSSAPYYTGWKGGFSTVMITDPVTGGTTEVNWVVSGLQFSATYPLPSSTLSFGGNFNGKPLYTGTPYFFIDRSNGTIRFRPSAVGINGTAGTLTDADRYAVCFLVNEYRKFKVTRYDLQNQAFQKDTVVRVGQVRRDAFIYVSDCNGNQGPRNTDVTFDPPGSGGTAVIDSITRINVVTCNSTYASVVFEDTPGLNGTVDPITVTWDNRLSIPDSFRNAIQPTIFLNNTSRVIVGISVQGNPRFARTKTDRDSVDLIFTAKDNTCPYPAVSIRRARIIFNKRDSVPVLTRIQGLNTNGSINQDTICVGETVTLRTRNMRPDSTQENPAKYRFQWTNQNGSPITGVVPGMRTNDSVITVRPSASTTYRVVIRDDRWREPDPTDPSGVRTLETRCADTGRVNVVVYYPVIPDFKLAYAQHPDGGKKGIAAPLQVTFVNNTPLAGIDSLKWSMKRQNIDPSNNVIGEEDLGVFSRDTTPAPLNLEQEGRYIITLSTSRKINGVSTCGTSFSDTVLVPYGGLPNVITPNNDGRNERLILTSRPDVMELSIYNRWGQQVHKFDNYFNEFDGRDKNGNQLPAGVYFYTVTNKETNSVSKHWMQILR